MRSYMFGDRQVVPTAWRQAAFAALSLVLLVPVPVLAAYTLGTWTQVAGPDTWSTSGSSGLDLALPPVEGVSVSGTVEFTFIAQVAGSANNVSVTPSNFNAFAVSSFSQNRGLIVTVGFSPDTNPANLNRTVFLSNQFNTGTLPSSLTGTNTPQNIVNGDYAVVKFTFSNPSTWGPTVPSSAIHITFSAGN